MYIVKTPFRVSFFGGGTDFEAYYREHGGSVISSAINKYCYVTVRYLPPFFSYRNQLTYSKIERFNHPSEVEHPLVREALRFLPVDNVQISYDADLPACSGIGSSSSFAVGLLKGLHAMRNEFPDPMTLAKEAIRVERELCGEAGGVQDQLAASFGGFHRYFFSRDSFRVEPIKITKEAKEYLFGNLLLLFTGFTRFAADVSENQQNNLPHSLAYLDEMKQLTDEAETLLNRNDIDGFGRLLGEEWKCKKMLSHMISNDSIDEIYQRAIKAGALGGKLIGAGSGGFILLYAPQEAQRHIMDQLSGFQFVRFDADEAGSVFMDSHTKANQLS